MYLRYVFPLFLALTVWVMFNLISTTLELYADVSKSLKMRGYVARVIKDIDIFNASTKDSFEGYKEFETNDTLKMKNELDKYGNRINSNASVRQRKCNSCFEHDFNYVIQNEKICKLFRSNESIDLLILIFTIHKNVEERSALRTTWLSYTKNNSANVRYAFLLGETNETRYKQAVLNENQRFRDIIKEDFIDKYTNLTYKTIMGFKYAATKCAHAHYVMKTDDDVFLNIPNLLKFLKSSARGLLQSSVIGFQVRNLRPQRSIKSRIFASETSYPDKIYPDFCSGTGYVTSMGVVTAVYKISPSVPFFHLEDIYVSLCLQSLGLNTKHWPGFNYQSKRMGPCDYKGEDLITAHKIAPDMLHSIWQMQCNQTQDH